MMSSRVRIIAAVAIVVLLATAVWLWLRRGLESTDDAQVDAYVTPVASRVGGTVLRVAVGDNQQVEAGAVLVEIDPRDYEVALERARAELANAEAESLAANANVPITSTTTTNTVSAARGGVERARGAVIEAEHGLEAAKARLATAQARKRELEATAVRAGRDVERLKELLAKDEIPQQQFDTAETRARAASAAARVKQAAANVKQAELNLEYATVKAPFKGTVSRKAVQPGQVVQPGQPMMTLIPLEQVWITANFKETQLEDMRPGQRATVDVDAYGGRSFEGKVDSIAAATGSRFSLLPPENASGNFVKVVQRVPVKIVLDKGQDPEHLLRPGMSVTPTVYTK
jgi:membrane fusion protein (multidrug efflux system)